MIGSVHGCVSCPVVVKPWEPHPLTLPQHPHHPPSLPSSQQPVPQPYPQRSTSIHPWPPLLPQDIKHDTSHPRTSSPNLPEDGPQESSPRHLRKGSDKEKEIGSPLFLFPSKPGHDNTAWREQSRQLDITSDLDSSLYDSKSERDNGETDIYQIQKLGKKEITDIPLIHTLGDASNYFKENGRFRKQEDTSIKESKDFSSSPAESEGNKNTVQPVQQILRRGYKSRGTQTPPIPATPRSKQDTITQTSHSGPISAESASNRGLPKISKTKAPLRSAWKPDESSESHQASLRKRLPALPKPKPLKARWDKIPYQSSNLSHTQMFKKPGDSKKKNRTDAVTGPVLSDVPRRTSRISSLTGQILVDDLTQKSKTDSFIWVSHDNQTATESAEGMKSEIGSIGTPAWLSQLTLPSFPTSFYGSDSASKSGSISYETSETVSQNNHEFSSASLYCKKSPSPAEQSSESSTVNSSESGLATPPKVAPEVDALTTAAAAGDMATVKKLLKGGGVDVNATNSFGRTAIQVMIHDNPDLAEMLMKAGADPNTSDVGKKAASSTFRTVAHDVAASGYTDTLRCLLRHGADLNLQDRWGNTPLHLAAKASHLPAVRLLRRGTSLQMPNRQGRTPISILEESSDPSIQQWVEMKKSNASRLQTLCVLAVRKELGPFGLRCWCRHAPDPMVQRQVLLQCRSPPPLPSASTAISNRFSATSKTQKNRGRGSGSSQSLMTALTSRHLLDFLTFRDLIPRRLSSGENTSLEVQNTSSVYSNDDALSLGPHAASSMASDNGSLFDPNLSSIDASHSADDVSLPSFDQSL